MNSPGPSPSAVLRSLSTSRSLRTLVWCSTAALEPAAFINYQLNPEGVARLRTHFEQMWTKALSNFQTAAEARPIGAKHGKPSRTRSKVLKSVRVKAPIEGAWSVFVEQMEMWWPATHHIGNTPFESILHRTSRGRPLV